MRRKVILGSGPRSWALSITPDSFLMAENTILIRRPSLDENWPDAQAMIESGATFLDIGGSSSRPGCRTRISAPEEIAGPTRR